MSVFGGVPLSDLFGGGSLTAGQKQAWVADAERNCVRRGIAAPCKSPEFDEQMDRAYDEESSLRRRELGIKTLEDHSMITAMQTDSEARADSAEIQATYDPAYRAATGAAAPPRVYGESLDAYNLRLVRPLQKHSAQFAKVDFGKIGDATAAKEIAARIRSDALATLTQNEGPLKSHTTPDAVGRLITRFSGAPGSCWNQFKAPYRLVKGWGDPGSPAFQKVF